MSKPVLTECPTRRPRAFGRWGTMVLVSALLLSAAACKPIDYKERPYEGTESEPTG
jgi:hypothetical protein